MVIVWRLMAGMEGGVEKIVGFVFDQVRWGEGVRFISNVKINGVG